MDELWVEAKVENLDAVLDFVSGHLEAAECPVKVKNQIAIAAEEIFVNIACYAYPPETAADSAEPSRETGGAMVRIAIADEVVLAFEDKGKAYNPLERDDPDTAIGAEEREIGGLGIYMVKKMMDAVEYRREEDKNILLIRKAVKPN